MIRKDGAKGSTLRLCARAPSRRERERERPTEDEERGWSTHVREAFPPRGTGGGAHHLLVAPSAPSFHPRFFRPMAKRCPPPTPTPTPTPRTDTGSRAAANAASLQAKKGASKKKVRPHARLENRYVSVSCRLTRNQIFAASNFRPFPPRSSSTPPITGAEGAERAMLER